MIAPGHHHVVTPLTGLVDLVISAPVFTELTARAADRSGELDIAGPTGAQLFVACAIARGGPLLVVTATGREAVSGGI